MVCTKRGVPCHFSVKSRKARQRLGSTINTCSARLESTEYTQNLPSSGSAHISAVEAKEPPAQQERGTPPRLYVDHVLEVRNTSGRRRNGESVLKAHDYYVGSSGVAFFSEKRITSISNRLGHTKLKDHIDTLAAAISSRMNLNIQSSGSVIKFSGPTPHLKVSADSTKSYIKAYFVHVHPLYPFLDREDFEEKASNADQIGFLEGSPPFSALYHSVLALGCQYQDGGAFDPGKGMAWKLFQTSLGLLSDILVPKEALVNVQAITAMAIFAHNSSCLQIGSMLATEAARMAQTLGFNKATCPGKGEDSCHRTFWVIYILEKLASFACGRSSIIIDYDIGSPIPEAPDSIFQGFDWFFAMARFSRLTSRAYELLFSISATLNSTESFHKALDSVNDDLEAWRLSIPEGFRPGEPFRPRHYSDPSSVAVLLRVQYHYYSVVIALSRICIHGVAGSTSDQRTKSNEALLDAARVIIELTRHIDMEAHVPIWVLGSMPLSALFILFDFVVHNPTHPQTQSNLILLGVAAGYFCRLEHASGGSLPSSLLSDFAHIARQYVQDFNSEPNVDAARVTDMNQSSRQSDVVNSGPQTPPLSVPLYNYDDETLANPLTMDSLAYAATDVPFSVAEGLSNSIDIMGFFDNIAAIDYGNSMNWMCHGQMQADGS
ncbi:hypothetical protein BDZ45DRAFT_637155 [Acephala macrosclerotiorum]|nr:hypothetical protein BDZ45DRAFT_637155 [Acephala macrosclerotiorum]